MNNGEYTTLVGEIIQNIKRLFAAENPSANEMIQHGAKFMAVLDRQHRKLLRQAEAAKLAAKAKDTK